MLIVLRRNLGMRTMSTLKRIKKIEIEKFLAKDIFDFHLLSPSQKRVVAFSMEELSRAIKQNECEKGPTDPFLGCQTK